MAVEMVKFGELKRAEAVLVTPSPTLTDPLIEARKRLVIHSLISHVQVKFHIGCFRLEAV